DAEGGPLSSGWHLSARRGGRFVASARPGPGGAFELRGLPRGAVTLHAGSKGRTVDLGTVELPGETPAEWRVPAE
ncbi:MAG: hypothetical protein L6R43_17635, partial [Planctomycetes bacterium]|nr:hypothetical protein [Planctomycetota bacterium]